MTAHDILNNPFLNKGTAFTLEERKELGLIGLLPPYVQTIEEQAAQTYAQMQTKANDLEKRLFLMEIFKYQPDSFLLPLFSTFGGIQSNCIRSNHCRYH